MSGVHDEAFDIERDPERSTRDAPRGAAERVIIVATHQKMQRSALARLAALSDGSEDGRAPINVVLSA